MSTTIEELTDLRLSANADDNGTDAHDRPPGQPGEAWTHGRPPGLPGEAWAAAVDAALTGSRNLQPSSKDPRMTSKNSASSRRSRSKEPRVPSKSRADIVRQSSKREVVRQISEFEQQAKLGTLAKAGMWTRYVFAVMQKYSLPLISGVTLALVWSNVDQQSHHDLIESKIAPGAVFEGHGIHLHFIVNDIFMCFFFGLAIKEVTEALLPGGSLNPLRRAVNPLMATLGGVVGPVVAYAIMIVVLYQLGTFDGQMCIQAGDAVGEHRRLGGVGGGDSAFLTSEPCTRLMLLKGWGVPTATDISLAWMFALQVFGVGHPAINFMLLLAIVDDALGMIIIAVFYPDPQNPVKPLWLLMVVAASALAFAMRKMNVQSWVAFIVLCGPISWYGLIRSHVHPALALVFVVPFMPATSAVHAPGDERNLGACDLGPARELVVDLTQEAGAGPEQSRVEQPEPRASITSTMARITGSSTKAFSLIMGYHEEEAPLHVFEEHMKLVVDLGMFFFGLANAGVQLGSMGGMTAAVFVALLLGKTLGIALFSLLAVRLGFGLPEGLTVGDLFAMAAIAGVGLTVALFVANEAFVDPELRGQAKMGAVLSIVCGGVGWGIRRLSRSGRTSQE